MSKMCNTTIKFFFLVNLGWTCWDGRVAADVEALVKECSKWRGSRDSLPSTLSVAVLLVVSRHGPGAGSLHFGFGRVKIWVFALCMYNLIPYLTMFFTNPSVNSTNLLNTSFKKY